MSRSRKPGVRSSAVFAVLGVASAASALPDVVLCQLYDLGQWSSSGGMRMLALATTSWNIGDTDLQWYENPDARHPFIAQNMYRLQDDRFEQIGTSWLKHGFYALSNLQCDNPNLPNCVFQPGHGEGDWLGQGCTDTYDAFLNANDLGPRFEVNPWTGAFNYATSMYNTGGMPSINQRRLRVADADMDAALNPDSTYFFEGYYVHFQDRDHMNSAAWKTCVPVRSGTGSYTFQYSSAATLPNWGFAINAWAGANQTIVAQSLPVVEGSSPDGRCVLAYKVTDNGDGTWHYEYALLNVDMDRQIDAFSVPIPDGVTVTNIGFHAPPITEPKAYVGGPATDSSAWANALAGGKITWSTSTNPLRWGTLYNFRFDADQPPTDVQAEFSRFKTGQAGDISIFGGTQGPSAPVTPACPGDTNNDLTVNVDDLNAILGAWGTNVGVGSPLDLAGDDGIVTVDDLNVILGAWGVNCM